MCFAGTEESFAQRAYSREHKPTESCSGLAHIKDSAELAEPGGTTETP
jgi:hypothetical protein